MTPVVLGVEPVVATTGKYAGTRDPAATSRTQGLAFMRALDAGAAAARRPSGATSPATTSRPRPFSDNVVLDYAGVPASTLTRRAEAAAAGAGRPLRRQPARRPRARCAWPRWRRTSTTRSSPGSAAPSDDAVFYYRIHSPVILIEFDHQPPVGCDQPVPAGGRSRATSTPWCARPTATTTARICCGSTSRAPALRRHRACSEQHTQSHVDGAPPAVPTTHARIHLHSGLRRRSRAQAIARAAGAEANQGVQYKRAPLLHDRRPPSARPTRRPASCSPSGQARRGPIKHLDGAMLIGGKLSPRASNYPESPMTSWSRFSTRTRSSTSARTASASAGFARRGWIERDSHSSMTLANCVEGVGAGRAPHFIERTRVLIPAKGSKTSSQCNRRFCRGGFLDRFEENDRFQRIVRIPTVSSTSRVTTQRRCSG